MQMHRISLLDGFRNQGAILESLKRYRDTCGDRRIVANRLPVSNKNLVLAAVHLTFQSDYCIADWGVINI